MDMLLLEDAKLLSYLRSLDFIVPCYYSLSFMSSAFVPLRSLLKISYPQKSLAYLCYMENKNYSLPLIFWANSISSAAPATI